MVYMMHSAGYNLNSCPVDATPASPAVGAPLLSRTLLRHWESLSCSCCLTKCTTHWCLVHRLREEQARLAEEEKKKSKVGGWADAEHRTDTSLIYMTSVGASIKRTGQPLS